MCSKNICDSSLQTFDRDCYFFILFLFLYGLIITPLFSSFHRTPLCCQSTLTTTYKKKVHTRRDCVWVHAWWIIVKGIVTFVAKAVLVNRKSVQSPKRKDPKASTLAFIYLGFCRNCSEVLRLYSASDVLRYKQSTNDRGRYKHDENPFKCDGQYIWLSKLSARDAFTKTITKQKGEFL